MSENSETKIEEILGGDKLSGGFSSLLQNPEIAAKLPRIMEALAPVMAEMRAEQAQSESVEKTAESVADGNADVVAAAAKESEAALAGLLSGGGGAHKSYRQNKKRTALLKAVEPYLSDNRKEALDYVIKVTTLIDLLSEVM